MYLLEGVIATIEVKSTLTKKSLFEALENTMSLLQLTPGLVHTYAARWMSRVKAIESDGYTPREAMRKAGFEFMPATYIYSFNSKLRAKGIRNNVDNWFRAKKQPTVCDDHCAVLPRVIACGNSLGLLNDGLMRIDPDETVVAEWRKDNSGPNHVMVILGHETTFRMAHDPPFAYRLFTNRAVSRSKWGRIRNRSVFVN